MAKYLIIFGAGASYGSDFTGAPPLGGNLFKEQRGRFSLFQKYLNGLPLLPDTFSIPYASFTNIIYLFFLPNNQVFYANLQLQ